MAMHAGHSETALMLALAPECVHMERAVANFPGIPLPNPVERPPGGAWASYDFGPSGELATRPRRRGSKAKGFSTPSPPAGRRRSSRSTAWLGRTSRTDWGKQHWHGFVQSLPPSFAAESSGALMNTRLTPVFTLLTVAALATSASCFAAEKFTFSPTGMPVPNTAGFTSPCHRAVSTRRSRCRN